MVSFACERVKLWRKDGRDVLQKRARRARFCRRRENAETKLEFAKKKQMRSSFPSVSRVDVGNHRMVDGKHGITRVGLYVAARAGRGCGATP